MERLREARCSDDAEGAADRDEGGNRALEVGRLKSEPTNADSFAPHQCVRYLTHLTNDAARRKATMS
jgi:hypothetical protein